MSNNERMQEIRKECEEMQKYLEMSTSDNPEELVGRLSELNIILARSGVLLAEAKKIQDNVVAFLFETRLKEISSMPSNIAKQYITGFTSEYNQLVLWIDRINRTCVHQGDNIRTQISFAKEELKLTRSGY